MIPEQVVVTLRVGIDGQRIWENVNASIKISEGRTIEIMLYEGDVDYHFGKVNLSLV